MSAPVRPPAPGWDVVVPTVGRPSLARTLTGLALALGDREATAPDAVVVVDDRPARGSRSPVLDTAELPGTLRDRVRVVRSGGRGPAAARNAGTRACAAPWVVFLDDDVVPGPRWAPDLLEDLRAVPADVAGVQARLVVPRSGDERPTDQERSDLALEDARWATADMAYRRDALRAAGGFDERFPRAFREDADLALRLRRAGWRLRRGRRTCLHPPRDAPWSASVRRQRGNADDALMRALHGPRWRTDAEAPPGRRPRHLLATGLLLAAPAALRLGHRSLARAAGLGWAALTAELALARIAPGPRTPREVGTMVITSVLIPPAAVAHWARGWAAVLRAGRPLPQPTRSPLVRVAAPREAARA